MLLKYLRKDIELVLNKQFFSGNDHEVEFQEIEKLSKVSFPGRSNVSKIYANIGFEIERINKFKKVCFKLLSQIRKLKIDYSVFFKFEPL
jgi:hypothetical protein